MTSGVQFAKAEKTTSFDVEVGGELYTVTLTGQAQNKALSRNQWHTLSHHCLDLIQTTGLASQFRLDDKGFELKFQNHSVSQVDIHSSNSTIQTHNLGDLASRVDTTVRQQLVRVATTLNHTFNSIVVPARVQTPTSPPTQARLPSGGSAPLSPPAPAPQGTPSGRLMPRSEGPGHLAQQAGSPQGDDELSGSESGSDGDGEEASAPASSSSSRRVSVVEDGDARRAHPATPSSSRRGSVVEESRRGSVVEDVDVRRAHPAAPSIPYASASSSGAGQVAQDEVPEDGEVAQDEVPEDGEVASAPASRAADGNVRRAHPAAPSIPYASASSSGAGQVVQTGDDGSGLGLRTSANPGQGGVTIRRDDPSSVASNLPDGRRSRRRRRGSRSNPPDSLSSKRLASHDHDRSRRTHASTTDDGNRHDRDRSRRTHASTTDDGNRHDRDRSRRTYASTTDDGNRHDRDRSRRTYASTTDDGNRTDDSLIGLTADMERERRYFTSAPR